MKAVSIILFILTTNCISDTTIAQPVYRKPFKILTVADGLPQSFISGIVQDSTGFIWIGTRDGLARYDGRNFKIFRHVPVDTATLANNVIINLFLDKQSRLWIIYETGDVDILNTTTEKLFHFTNDPVYRQVYNRVRIGHSISEDNNGNIWILRNNKGVFICNLNNHFLHFYSYGSFGLKNAKLVGIASNNGNIVLATDTAFITLNSSRKIVNTILYTFSNPHIYDAKSQWKDIYPLFRQNGEMILHDEGRLIIYHPATKSFTVIKLPGISPYSNCLAVDSKGRIYFDNNEDICTLTLNNEFKIWKPSEQNTRWGFESILIDRSGVLWMGGNGSGMQLYDLRLPRLSGISYNKNFQVDVLQNILHVPQYEIEKNILYNIQSYYLRWSKGTDNDIWLSRGGMQENEHLEVFHYKNHHLISPRWNYTDTVKSHHVQINSLALSPSGKLWGIDFFLRPVYFDTLTWSATVYPPVDSVNVDYTFTASSLLMDGEDTFWISTALDGLFFYNKQSNKTLRYFADGLPGSLPTNQLMTIVQDSKNANILWIGSLGGGLIKFNKLTGRCAIYTTKQGLPNNTVYAVLIDKKGILWCSSNKGIFSFDPQTNEIRSYTSKDGLPGDEFNRYHYLQLPDGRIAFGGVDGYTVFNPLTLASDNFAPPTALTGIRVNNIPADFGDTGSPFQQALNSLQQIRLPYDKNFLSFEFAALEYNIPDKLQYRYMLEGFDKGWVYAGNNNVAAYTKIPAGNYTLKINATNTAGEWSSFVKTLPVIITPPFWQTWWFIALIAAAAAALVYFFVRLRIITIRKEERQKIKFELEASGLKAQALRAQMNPHFVFNCLNSIKALIQEDKKKEAVIYLTTFSKLIRSQLNNAEQEVSLHDELETCKLYGQLEALRFGDKIVTEFKVDENIDIYSLKVPPLLLQPFIENAIWHGILPKQQGKVTVSVVQENESINCLIDDDGIGREMAMSNKLQASSTYESKGMGLVKNRLTMYNNINANKASIEVIDKKENNKPAGTLIIIKFKQEA